MGFGLIIGFIQFFDTVLDLTTQYTIKHTLAFTVMASLPLLGSGFKQQTFSFLWVPQWSPASATSFSQQQLTMTELQ
jgi:hypothetical protein